MTMSNAITEGPLPEGHPLLNHPPTCGKNIEQRDWALRSVLTPEQIVALDAGQPFQVTREQYVKYRQLGEEAMWADARRLAAEEKFLDALNRVDGNDRPAFLGEWYADDMISRRQLRELIGEAWNSADYPEQALGRDAWLDMFRNAGFVHSPDSPRKRPRKPLVIHRGAVYRRRYGMAWTTDREKAVWFAEKCSLVTVHGDARHGWALGRLGIPYPKKLTRGMVFTATIAPEHVLAMFDDRKESEVVIDPAGLPPLGRQPGIPLPQRWHDLVPPPQ
jgi:hypothetical protein